MEGDPLTDVLTLASARCVRIGTLKAGGTWALKFPPPQKIKLTAVVKGTCWVPVDGERALRLETGDVFVVPAERSYVLASDLKASQLDGLAWHPSNINPSWLGWIGPPHTQPIRIHTTHPERIDHATCVNPPSTNSSTPLM